MSALDVCVQGAEQTLEWTKRRQPGHVEYMNGYADGIKNARNFVRNEFEDDEFEDNECEDEEEIP